MFILLFYHLSSIIYHHFYLLCIVVCCMFFCLLPERQIKIYLYESLSSHVDRDVRFYHLVFYSVHYVFSLIVASTHKIEKKTSAEFLL